MAQAGSWFLAVSVLTGVVALALVLQAVIESRGGNRGANTYANTYADAGTGMNTGMGEAVPVTVGEAAQAAEPARRVGIVVGHWGYDPGAVCPDGLTEQQVNLTVAGEVVSLLKRKGYQVDLLYEYDPLLTDYRADALVSIHADSCNIPGASGFKVARVTYSAIPRSEDELVACLYREYAAITGMPIHPASVTDDMTNYHAFNEIAPETPGAIIELGFMLDDREMLVGSPKVLARGVASGIVCFLEE